MKQQELDFGDYVKIEQHRFGSENEMYTHKVIGRLRSNTYVDVPVRITATEVLHDEIVDVVNCVCCGVNETEVRKYKISDVQKIETFHKREMKDKHTPGPWAATKFGSIEYKHGILGEAYDFNPGFDAMEAEKLPHMANARLMAAAPELLEFVQYVAKGIPVGDDPCSLEELEESLDHLEERAKRLVSKIEGDEGED